MPRFAKECTIQPTSVLHPPTAHPTCSTHLLLHWPRHHQQCSTPQAQAVALTVVGIAPQQEFTRVAQRKRSDGGLSAVQRLAVAVPPNGVGAAARAQASVTDVACSSNISLD